jgi:hypothetical protein
VPGCNGKNLYQLWQERPSGVSEPTLVSWDGHTYLDNVGSDINPAYYRWIGGSEANQRWFRWFCQINHQAYAGALDESAFSVMRDKWHDCFGSDYDGTSRTPSNGLRFYVGTLGDHGFSYPVQTYFMEYEHVNAVSDPPETTQDPVAAHVQNSPHLYSDVSAWQWDKWRVGQTDFPHWDNSDDAFCPTYNRAPNGRGAPWGDQRPNPDTTSTAANPGNDSTIGMGDDVWEENSIRFNRWTLDNITHDNLPSEDKSSAIAWLTLPHQPLNNFGPDRSTSTQSQMKYNGLQYLYDSNYPEKWAYVPTHQSAYSLCRELADCRARGINEFIVWNDTGPDADSDPRTSTPTPWLGHESSYPNGIWEGGEGFYLDRGIHPDWPANWNILRDADNQVFSYDCYSVGLQNSSTWNYPSGGTGAPALIHYADESDAGANPGQRSLSVNAQDNSNQTKASVVFTFRPRDQENPLAFLGNNLNLNIRARAGLAGTATTSEASNIFLVLEVYHFSGSSGIWRAVGYATTDIYTPDNTPELDGLIYRNGEVRTTLGAWVNLRARMPLSLQNEDDPENPYAGVVSTTGEVRIRVSMRFPAGSAHAMLPVLTVDHATVYCSNDIYVDPQAPGCGARFLVPGDLNTDGVVDQHDKDLFNQLIDPEALPGTNSSDGIHPMYRMFADLNRDGVLHTDYTGTAITGGDGFIYWTGNPADGVKLWNYGYDITHSAPRDGFNDAYKYSALELPGGCLCSSDIGAQGGIGGADCHLDNNDFIVYINYFFSSDIRADFGRQGGIPGQDGLFDNNDFIVFINLFFSGCN